MAAFLRTSVSKPWHRPVTVCYVMTTVSTTSPFLLGRWTDECQSSSEATRHAKSRM